MGATKEERQVLEKHKLPIKGKRIPDFAEYDAIKYPALDEARGEHICYKCNHWDCIISGMPNKKLRRCLLEEWLYQQAC